MLILCPFFLGRGKPPEREASLQVPTAFHRFLDGGFDAISILGIKY